MSTCPSPEPAEWGQLLEHEVGAFRSLTCPHYDECLTSAAKRFWEGFSCVCCPLRGQGEALCEAPLSAPEPSFSLYVRKDRP